MNVKHYQMNSINQSSMHHTQDHNQTYQALLQHQQPVLRRNLYSFRDKSVHFTECESFCNRFNNLANIANCSKPLIDMQVLFCNSLDKITAKAIMNEHSTNSNTHLNQRISKYLKILEKLSNPEGMAEARRLISLPPQYKTVKRIYLDLPLAKKTSKKMQAIHPNVQESIYKSDSNVRQFKDLRSLSEICQGKLSSEEKAFENIKISQPHKNSPNRHSRSFCQEIKKLPPEPRRSSPYNIYKKSRQPAKKKVQKKYKLEPAGTSAWQTIQKTSKFQQIMKNFQDTSSKLH